MSPTKLNVLCDKIIEAGWLAIIICVPLFFSSFFTSQVDADKLALMYPITGVMIAAWVIKWIAERGAARKRAARSLRSPMALAVLCLVGAYLLATLASIAPRISLFGFIERPQGMYVLLSYIVVFAMIAQGLCTRAQLNRLIVTIILTSLPIALYGIIQKYGLDPQIWSEDFEGRFGSTLGNPIFLGAYLIMVFPLTLGKIVESARAVLAARETGTSVVAEIVLVIIYALIACIQAVAIVLADSRGPLLGWFVGVVFFALLMALIWRKRRFVLSTIGVGIAGIAFLVVLNLPNTPLEGLRAIPVFARMGNLANPTGEFRLFTWENAARLAFPHAPIQFPDGTPDALNVIRPLVGYGPDALALVYDQVSPATPFSRDTKTDRSHNVTWDAWVMTGLIGLVAYQLLFLSIFLYGFRWLDLIKSSRQRNTFIGLWIGLGATGGLTAIILRQPGLLAIGLSAGNIAALLVYLVVYAIQTKDESPTTTMGTDQIFLVACLAGLFGHYVESQFGIAVPASETLVWVFAGLLSVLGTKTLEVWQSTSEAERSGAEPSRVSTRWIGSVASYASVIALIISTLVYEFTRYESSLSNPFVILWRTLTFDNVRNSTTFVIMGLVLATWITATLVAWLELDRAHTFQSQASTRTAGALLAALPIVLSAIFAIGLAFQLGAVIRVAVPVGRVEDVLTLSRQVVGIAEYFIASLFVLLTLATIALAIESGPLPKALANKAGLIALVPVILAAFLWINTVNLTPLRAGVVFQLGKGFDDQSDWNTAIVLYKQAIRVAPANDAYYMKLARTYQQKSVLASTTSPSLFNARTSMEETLGLDDQLMAGLNRLDLLYAAQAMLMRARDLNPLYADHTINLARFYVPELPLDTPTKAKLVDLANEYYAEAQRLNPNSVLLWNERADFDLTYKNDPDAAIQKLEESLARDSQFDQTYLSLGKAYEAKKDLAPAIEAYQKAASLDPKSADPQGRLAYLYYREGRVDESIQAYLNYINLAPDAQNVWEAHKNLALIYKQTGNLAGAIREAQVAARLAPNEYAAQLNDLVIQLQKQ